MQFLLVAIGLCLVFLAYRICGWLSAIAMNTKAIAIILETSFNDNSKKSEEIQSTLKNIREDVNWIAIEPKRSERKRTETYTGRDEYYK